MGKSSVRYLRSGVRRLLEIPMYLVVDEMFLQFPPAGAFWLDYTGDMAVSLGDVSVCCVNVLAR